MYALVLWHKVNHFMLVENTDLWRKLDSVEKCISHIFPKVLSQLWKSIFDHFINKAWPHAGTAHAEALDLTMGLWTPVSMATVANSSFQSWWQFSPMAWISYKTKYSQRPFWANSLAVNLLIGNNLQLIHTFQGSSVFS